MSQNTTTLSPQAIPPQDDDIVPLHFRIADMLDNEISDMLSLMVNNPSRDYFITVSLKIMELIDALDQMSVKDSSLMVSPLMKESWLSRINHLPVSSSEVFETEDHG